MPPQNAKNISITTESISADIGPEAIQIDDKIYCAKILSDIHPGGDIFVKAFAGLDATKAFLSYHRRNFPHSSMIGACIGATPSRVSTEYMADYLELCQLVEKVLPRHKSFAPLTYYIKISFILIVAVFLELYIHITKSYHWQLTGLLGFFMALIGLNVQHDANHGAISKYPMINRLLGLSQNWIGGSSLNWIHQHVVQHHIHTNDVHHDPDLRGNPMIRLNPLNPISKFQCVQQVYTFFLMLVFGFSMVVTTFFDVCTGKNMTPFSRMVSLERVFEATTSIIFYIRWFLLPFLWSPTLKMALNIAPLFIVGGFYLAFFFIISHNFVGVHMFDNKSKRKSTFLYDQAASSSNVGGAGLCFINGGLNYQIEHHLFPRIQHSHYPTIAPVVRQFCKERNIPYVHFPTIYGNFASCVSHLYIMGTKTNPANFSH